MIKHFSMFASGVGYSIRQKTHKVDCGKTVKNVLGAFTFDTKLVTCPDCVKNIDEFKAQIAHMESTGQNCESVRKSFNL